MKIIDVQQGTPEWNAVRAKHNTASEAPAMMGASKYMSRQDLVRQKASGFVQEITPEKQRLFSRGHEAEAAARAFFERRIGEDLYPTTATDDAGYLLASFDGITMDERTGFEHKLWNEDLAAQVCANDLDPHYYWQLEQQILVGGLEKVIFVCSDGTEESCVSMEYRAVPGRAEQLLAGWKQFDDDVANYQHVEVLPAPTGRAIQALPALTVEIAGEVRSTNLAVYRATALDFIASINTDLQTDQDFADAEKTIKFCESTEQELEIVKKAAQAQSSSIDELFRTIDVLKEEMRQKRLTLDKLVKARKETIRAEIQQAGQRQMAEHIATLNERLGDSYIMSSTADFSGVMKGKKTVSSLKDAVATELARVKIETSAVADKIEINIKAFAELAAGKEFLFNDLRSLVMQPKEAFTAMVENRINKHAEQERQRLDAERERIRKEEEARAQAAANVQPIAPTLGEVLHAAAPAAIAQAIAPIETGATMKLGEICTAIGVTVTADFLARLGFQPVSTEKNTKLYRQSSFPAICNAISRHIDAVAITHQRAA